VSTDEPVKKIPESSERKDIKKETKVQQEESESPPAQNIKLQPEEDNEYINQSYDEERMSHPLFHIVDTGETLYSISRKYEIPLSDLFEFNEIDSNATIQIGQKIYLKNPFPESEIGSVELENNKKQVDSYIIHMVEKGETLYSISRKYNVTVEDIMNWNNKTDFDIKQGEELKIREMK
jgi:membrane-bound lytic murein transglycosylase D